MSQQEARTVRTTGRIEQLNVSPGGVPKRAVSEAVVNEYGLTRDRQRDRRHHGGTERAVCLFSAEILDGLRADGHQIGPGATGENVTIRGIDWKKLVPGSRIHLGEQVIVEVTSYAAPCRIISHCFKDGDFNVINQATHPGRSRLYARVVRQGTMYPGDDVSLEIDSAADRGARLQPKTTRWRPPSS